MRPSLLLAALLSIAALPATARTGTNADSGLIAHWRMDEAAGSVARDSSGHGADCDLKGARWRGHAVDFRGRGDWLEARSSSAGDIRGAFTIAFRIRPEAWADQYSAGIVSKKRSDADRGYVIYADGTRPAKITLRIAGADGSQPLLSSASSVDEGAWQHWAVTYDAAAGTVAWYKNGRPDCAYRNVAIGDTTNDTRLRLGYAHTWNGSFDGEMRDVRIYDRALSPAEIRSLCASPGERLHNPAVPIRWRIVRTLFPTSDLVVAGCTVKDAGAKGDGRTDDTAAFESALQAMKRAGGGTVFAPAGRYVIRGNLNIPTGVTLRGDWRPPYAGSLKGTVLMAYADRGDVDGRPFIGLRQSSGVKDLAVWYPEQRPNRIVPYPFCIEQMGSMAGTVQDVTLVNPYLGIRTDRGSELHYIHNVYGSPLSIGIEIDFVSDTGRVDEIAFGPDFWSMSGLPGAPKKGGPHAAWMRLHGTGMYFRRYEWIYSAFVSLRGYDTGIRMMNAQGLGETNGQMYFYDVQDCRVGVEIVDANFAGISFTRCHIEGDEYGIVTRPTFNSRILFHSCEIRGDKLAALLDGIADQSMIFERCRLLGGLERLHGDLAMLACSFGAAARHILLGPGVNVVTIAGSTFDGPAHISDESASGKVTIVDEPVRPLEAPACPPPIDRSLKPGRPLLFVVRRAPRAAGPADDTVAIRRALNAAARAGGGVVFLPPGIWELRGRLIVPTGVELRGCSDVEHHTRGLGSVVRVYAGRGHAGGAPAFSMRARSGMRGLTVYYPEQRHDAIAPYPFLIRGCGAGIYVVNTTAMNAYQLADFMTCRCDRHFVDYVAGAPLRYGIVVGGGSIGGVVRNVQFNPHYWFRSPFADCPGASTDEWARGKNPVWTYQYRNLEAFVLGDCKQELEYQNTVFGSRIGLHFVAQNGTGAGGLIMGHGTDGSLVSVAFDGLGRDGIDVVNSQLVTMDCTDVPPSEGKCYVSCGPDLKSAARMIDTTLWGSPANSAVVRGGLLEIDLAAFCHFGPMTVTGGELRLRGVYLGAALRPGPELDAREFGTLSATGCLSPRGLSACASSPGISVSLDGRMR
jgi:hypothetical protein